MSAIRRKLLFDNVIPYKNKLEYIEGSGTQYLDSEYVTNPNLAIEMKFSRVGDNTYSYFGSYNGTVSTMFECQGSGSSQYFQIMCSKGFGYELVPNYIYVLYADKYTFRLNGVTAINITSPNNVTNTLNIYIMARSNNGVGYNKMRGKLYYFKMWDNSKLVRYMIPVLDYNNVPCMYDKVTRKLFYNKGTGSFTYA